MYILISNGTQFSSKLFAKMYTLVDDKHPTAKAYQMQTKTQARKLMKAFIVCLLDTGAEYQKEQIGFTELLQ